MNNEVNLPKYKKKSLNRTLNNRKKYITYNDILNSKVFNCTIFDM